VNDTVATIQATKKLTGKNLTAGAFTFELVDEDGKILEAKNDSKGNITFNVAYTEAGTYTYTIREKAGTDESMSYDSKTYQVEVEVTAGEDGRLNAKVTYKTDSGNAPIFRNTYTPSATKITLEGTKELTGRDMTAGEFKFEVHDSKGNLVATGKNTAKGKINFTEIKLPQAGTYRLTVSEVDSKADNITYDTTEFKVVVVVKNDNGVLKAEVTYEKDIKFVNVYTPEPTEPPTEPPVVTITKDVTIDLKGRADEGACSVQIICDTQVIYDETVEQGTASIVLKSQTGSEIVKYTVIVNETDTWDEMVDFTS